MTSRHPRNISTFADALYDVVHQSKVSAKAQAEELGISYQLLVNTANHDLKQPRLHADRVVALTKASGNFALLDYMEQACGRVAMTIPPHDSSARDLMRAAVEASSRFGGLAQDIAAALHDERITAAEAAGIEEAGYRAAQAIMAAIAAAKAA